MSWTTIFTVALSGLQYGYNVGIITGAIVFVCRHLALSQIQETMAVSIVLLVGIIGSLIAAPIANRFGRKKALIVGAILFLLGSCIAGAFPALEMLLTGRAITGLALGIVYVVAPMYIAEVSPPEERGRNVSVVQLAITLGILVAYGASYLFAPDWQKMFLIGAVPACIQLICLFFIKESPLQKKAEPFQIGHLFTPTVRKATLLSFGLLIFQQVTGINSVVYFAPKIFEEAGLCLHSSAILATVGIGLINVVATIGALFLVDRWGRRPLLFWSFGGMFVCFLLMIVGLYTNIPIIDRIALGALMGLMAFFAIGLGPLPALLVSELMPSTIRAQTMGLATVISWIFNFLIVFSFPFLKATISSAGAFCFYGLFCILGFVLFYKFLPETNHAPLK